MMYEDRMDSFSKIVYEILQASETAIIDGYNGKWQRIKQTAADEGYYFDENLGDEKSDQGEGLKTDVIIDSEGKVRLTVYINGLALELTAREISPDEV